MILAYFVAFPPQGTGAAIRALSEGAIFHQGDRIQVDPIGYATVRRDYATDNYEPLMVEFDDPLPDWVRGATMGPSAAYGAGATLIAIRKARKVVTPGDTP